MENLPPNPEPISESLEDVADLHRWKIFFWVTILSTPVMSMTARVGIWLLTGAAGISPGPGPVGKMVQLAISSGPGIIFFAGCFWSGYCLLRSRQDSHSIRPSLFTVLTHGVAVFFGYIAVGTLIGLAAMILRRIFS